MLKNQSFPKCGLEKLKSLKHAVELHIKFSNVHLPTLRSMSEPRNSDEKLNPWKILKEGCYYLRSVHQLVKSYKECLPCLLYTSRCV